MNRSQFVQKFWPLASQLGAEFSLSPVAMISHALKEAGANNPNAAARHNYFGFLLSNPRRFVKYADDETGWRAYASRLAMAWPQAVQVSDDGPAFATAIAFAKNPTYVHDGPTQKAQYQRTLSSIYRSVQQDVARLGLRPAQVIAGPDSPRVFVHLEGVAGPTPAKDGVACIKKLCELDRGTHRLILQMQLKRADLQRRGINTASPDVALNRLIASYNARQKKVQASKLLKVQASESQLPKPVQAMIAKLKSLISGVGAIPLAVVIPIAAVVLLGVSYLVYNQFIKDQVQAQKDNDAAAHLSPVYGAMSAEEKEFDDNRSNQSYETGYKAGQQDGGPFGGLKTGALLLMAGILLAPKITGANR